MHSFHRIKFQASIFKFPPLNYEYSHKAVLIVASKTIGELLISKLFTLIIYELANVFVDIYVYIRESQVSTIAVIYSHFNNYR